MNKFLALLLATAFTSSIAATSPTVEVTADAPKTKQVCIDVQGKDGYGSSWQEQTLSVQGYPAPAFQQHGCQML